MFKKYIMYTHMHSDYIIPNKAFNLATPSVETRHFYIPRHEAFISDSILEETPIENIKVREHFSERASVNQTL